MTVTVKVPPLWLPAPSLAVQVTTVVPLEKVEPEGGMQLTITVLASG